jgi:hypothetical protein
MNRFPIIAIGGRSRLVALDSFKALYPHVGNEFICSTNGRLYPVSELRRVAPQFHGLACREYHPAEFGTGNRFAPATIGRIYNGYWSEPDKSIFAMFEPTTEALSARLLEHMDSNRLPDLSPVWTVAVHSLGDGYDLVFGIGKIDYLDFANTGASGGRFLSLAECITYASLGFVVSAQPNGRLAESKTTLTRMTDFTGWFNVPRTRPAAPWPAVRPTGESRVTDYMGRFNGPTKQERIINVKHPTVRKKLERLAEYFRTHGEGSR